MRRLRTRCPSRSPSSGARALESSSSRSAWQHSRARPRGDPAGATELLLWATASAAGRRPARVPAGSFAQVVTLARRRCRWPNPAGWRTRRSRSIRSQIRRCGDADPVERAARAGRQTVGRPPLVLRATSPTPSRSPRGAVVDPFANPRPRRDRDRPHARTSIVTRRRTGAGYLLARSACPSGLSSTTAPAGVERPCVEVTISGDEWTRVEHLHASRCTTSTTPPRRTRTAPCGCSSARGERP